MSNLMEDNTTILNQTSQFWNNSTLKEQQKEVTSLASSNQTNDSDNLIEEVSKDVQDEFQAKNNIQRSGDQKIVSEIKNNRSNRQSEVSIGNHMQTTSSSQKHLKPFDDQFELFEEILQQDFQCAFTQNDNTNKQLDESRMSSEFDKKCQIKNDLRKTYSDTSQNLIKKKLSITEFTQKEKSFLFSKIQSSEKDDQNTIGNKRNSLNQQNIVNQTPYLNVNVGLSTSINFKNKLNPQLLQSYKNIDRKSNDQFEQLFEDSQDALKNQNFYDTFCYSEVSQIEECSIEDLKQYCQNSSIYYEFENTSSQMESIKKQLYCQAYQDLQKLKQSKNQELLQYLQQINEQNSGNKVISNVRNRYLHKIKEQHLISD